VLIAFSATPYADQSPLEHFLSDSGAVHPYSHTLSRQFDYPIIFVSQADRNNPAYRQTLKQNLRLADNASNRLWLQKVHTALGQFFASGFTIKNDTTGQPCLITTAGSYDEHVTGENFLDLLSEYHYNPYRDRPEEFETMVLYHEIGHCFEYYDPVRAEHFADVMAGLFLLREKADWAVLDQEMIPNRTLNLLNGDFEHYSVTALNHIHDWVESPDELTNYDNNELIQLAHLIINSPGALPNEAQLNRLRTQLQFIILEIAIEIDQLDIEYFAGDTSDKVEEIRDYLVQRQASNRLELYGLLDDLEPGDVHQMKQLLGEIASNMYQVRLARNDLFNDPQTATYHRDVESLFEAVGFPAEELNLSFNER
jgi:hypothetical protein